jgi:AcrR family transcriptional regulator
LSQPGPLIRPPQQRRSQESLERVLQAGFELLRERGFEGFAVQEVSQRANVSIGSIYARAPSREALIQAVYERATLWTDEQAGSLEQAAHRPGRLASRSRRSSWSWARRPWPAATSCGYSCAKPHWCGGSLNARP